MGSHLQSQEVGARLLGAEGGIQFRRARRVAIASTSNERQQLSGERRARFRDDRRVLSRSVARIAICVPAASVGPTRSATRAMASPVTVAKSGSWRRRISPSGNRRDSTPRSDRRTFKPSLPPSRFVHGFRLRSEILCAVATSKALDAQRECRTRADRRAPARVACGSRSRRVLPQGPRTKASSIPVVAKSRGRTTASAAASGTRRSTGLERLRPA